MYHEGEQIGPYVLVRKLGRGGFGEVWLAEKRSQFLAKKVAVKLLHHDQVDFQTIQREAVLWEEASGHPNVLPIIDADAYGDQVVIVSEYADGGSLSDKLLAEGKPLVRDAVELTIGILNGLEFLHGKKIIHRDIKPQNILLQGKTPRLADFGISRAMQTTAVSSAIIGTDAYMSPEAFDGKRSVQTDIWSVGVVLYQLLDGNLPFPQEHPSERMFAVLTKDFPPLGNEIPGDLRTIVQTALAKLPENRFGSTTAMRDDLQKVLVNVDHPAFARTELLQIPVMFETGSEFPTIAKEEEPENETQPALRAANVVPLQFHDESVVTHVSPAIAPLAEPAGIGPGVAVNSRSAAQARFAKWLLAIAVIGGLAIVYAAFRQNTGSSLTNSNTNTNSFNANAQKSNTATTNVASATTTPTPYSSNSNSSNSDSLSIFRLRENSNSADSGKTRSQPVSTQKPVVKNTKPSGKGSREDRFPQQDSPPITLPVPVPEPTKHIRN